MQCASCGFETEESDASFCPNCGTKLLQKQVGPKTLKKQASPTTQSKFCNFCGAKAVDPDAKFCENCGGNLESTGAPEKEFETPASQSQPTQSQAQVQQPFQPVIAQKPSFYKIYGLHGAFYEGGKKYSGSLVLTSHYLALESRKKNARFNMEDIESAFPGSKNNVFYIRLYDGREIKFKVVNAQGYSSKINGLLKSYR